MIRLGLSRFCLVAALSALALSACAEPAAERAMGPASVGLLSSSQPKPLSCPTNTTVTSSDLLGLDGGTVSAAGTSLIVPAGALLEPTAFTVSVPAGNTMKVQVYAGTGAHFLFQTPATIVIDYSRCNRNDLLQSSLSVWYIDETTGAFLEKMPAVDNPLTRQITFPTGHLSSYVVAE